VCVFSPLSQCRDLDKTTPVTISPAVLTRVAAISQAMADQANRTSPAMEVAKASKTTPALEQEEEEDKTQAKTSLAALEEEDKTQVKTSLAVLEEARTSRASEEVEMDQGKTKVVKTLPAQELVEDKISQLQAVEMEVAMVISPAEVDTLTPPRRLVVAKILAMETPETLGLISLVPLLLSRLRKSPVGSRPRRGSRICRSASGRGCSNSRPASMIIPLGISCRV